MGLRWSTQVYGDPLLGTGSSKDTRANSKSG
jgi:hypothetical protein